MSAPTYRCPHNPEPHSLAECLEAAARDGVHALARARTMRGGTATMAQTLSAGALREKLDEFGDHVPVVIVLPDGEHATIADVADASAPGYTAVALDLGDNIQPGDTLDV